MGQWTTTAVGPASSQPEPERFKRATPGGMRVDQPTERPLNWREETLLKALKIAIANGWAGWKTHVNDAVTVGQEAEGVLRDYRKAAKPIEPLIFDHDFAKALWSTEGETLSTGGIGAFPIVPRWQTRLQQLALAQDRMKYLREVL